MWSELRGRILRLYTSLRPTGVSHHLNLSLWTEMSFGLIFNVYTCFVFIDIIHPAALWPWGWLSLQQKRVPGIFPGELRRPVSRADNLTTSMCRLSWNLRASTSWNPQGLSRAVENKHVLYRLCIHAGSRFYLTTRNHSSLNRFAWRHVQQRSPLFQSAVSRSPKFFG
jgi:hypothetical protein